MSKLKKVSPMRALACLLALFALLTVFTALAENAAEPEAVELVEAAAETADTGETDPEINILQGLGKIAQSTGIAQSFTDDGFEWRNYAMIAVACFLLYLAIVKQFEPLLLLPISFGMLLANLPAAGMMAHPSFTFFETMEQGVAAATRLGKDATDVLMRYNEATGTMMPALQTANGGLLYYLYQGVKLGIYPPLIFMGVGAMTDFGPLIANPKSLLLGAAAQLGIFLTFLGAKLLGFTASEAGAIGIIGGADGPTAIYLTTKLAPELLGPIAIAAYSYMALIPLIQPPIMKLFTTPEMRVVKMEQTREVSKTEKIVFPIVVSTFVILLLPSTAPLIGCLMFGNLCRETGVTDRLSDTMQNALMNIVTIFLATSVGSTMVGDNFLKFDTIKIIILGLIAFSISTIGGLLGGVAMYYGSGRKINPLIGSAGVSAVPMAARVSQDVGRKYNKTNFLLMHAMGPNVAGVIGSAIAAGFLLSVFG